MRAGELREKVTFQRSAPGAGDGAGNYGDDFANIPGAVRISADLAPVRQAEVVLSEGVKGLVLYECNVRYSTVLAGLTVGDRMIDARDASRVFNVKAPPINPDKRRRRLKILVEIGGASG